MTGAAFLLGLAAASVVFLAFRFLRPAPRPSCEGHRDSSSGGDPLVELSTLAGGLAHEIRNPLSTLKVNLALLAEDLRDESVSPRDLRRRSLSRLASLQAEVDRLNGILDDFLRFITRQELTLERCDVNEIVKALVTFFEPKAEEHGVAVVTQLAAEPLWAWLDADLFRQVLLNLGLNAQEAMPEGGTLTIRTARGQGDTVRVEVSDTGPGLAPDIAARVFLPYFSTKPRGSGLGLALARRFVEAQNGRIEVVSEPGRGATFIVTLPLAKA